MSLSIITMNKDAIIISADSRNCIEESGIKYLNHDSSQKLFEIDDMLIFASGCYNCITEILFNFRNLTEKTVAAFQEITHLNYLKTNELVNFIVAKFENGQPCIYQIISERNEYYRYTNQNKVDYWCCGNKQNEAHQLYDQAYDPDKQINLCELYQDIYNKLSDETVGGILTIYIVTANSIKKVYVNKIKESKLLLNTYREGYKYYLVATNANITGHISSSTISGSIITGGTINVTTDVNIGNKLIINPDGSSFTSGIQIGNDVEIYIDPVTKALYLTSPYAIYANGERIDTTNVAVFG